MPGSADDDDDDDDEEGVDGSDGGCDDDSDVGSDDDSDDGGGDDGDDGTRGAEPRRTRGTCRERRARSDASTPSGDAPRGTRGSATSSNMPRRSSDDGTDDEGIPCGSDGGSDPEEREERSKTVAKVRVGRPYKGDSLWVGLVDHTYALLRRADGSVARARFGGTVSDEILADLDDGAIAAGGVVGSDADPSVDHEGDPQRLGRMDGAPGEVGGGVVADGIAWLERITAAQSTVEADAQRVVAARAQLLSDGVAPHLDRASRDELFAITTVALPQALRGHLINMMSEAGLIAAALDRLRAGGGGAQTTETIDALRLIRHYGWVVHGPYPVEERDRAERETGRGASFDKAALRDVGWRERPYATFVKITAVGGSDGEGVSVATTVLSEASARAVSPPVARRLILAKDPRSALPHRAEGARVGGTPHCG
jgi:hypothetical protein